MAERGDVEGWILVPNDPVRFNSEYSFFSTDQMSRTCVLDLVGFARSIATVVVLFRPQRRCYHFKAGELIPGERSKTLCPEQLVELRHRRS